MIEVSLLNDEVQLYDINYKYRKYLYTFDYKVNLKNNRRFMGVLICVNDIHYLIPLTSHPKRKNGKRRNQRTTVEIVNESNELIAALLINNMIPVPPSQYHKTNIECDKDKDYLNSEYIYEKKESTKGNYKKSQKCISRCIYKRRFIYD